MYLKSLVIHGFKSFPNRTVLTFEPGTTVVVGPNGSGKSNISDAMRWVLGEVSSKNIRGNTMEDVIFGGTDTRRPMGYAEVSVTFDNSDPDYRLDSPYDEVTVTRRYYRGGTSEYLINNKPCLRKEIHELFYNTGVGRDGYSIIGQGKVAELVSKKSEERRNVFEEAAGIAKYRHSKHETELNLENTMKNMDTTYVQISMYEEQLVPLEKEAEKQRKADAIREEKKAVDVALWLYDTAKIHVDVQDAKIAYVNSKEEFNVLDASISKMYEERERLDTERLKAIYDSEDLLQTINQLDEKIKQIDIRSAEIAESIKNSNSNLIRSQEVKEKLRLQINRFEEKIKDYQDKINEIKESIDAVKVEKLEVAAEQSGVLQRAREIEQELASSQKNLTELEESLSEQRVHYDVVLNSQKNSLSRLDSTKHEIDSYEDTQKSYKTRYDLARKNSDAYQNKIAEYEENIKNYGKEIAKINTEIVDFNHQLGVLQVQHDSKVQRAQDLQKMTEQMEGYFQSVKTVMNEYEEGNIPNATKIYGPISTLISISPKHVTALEAALGSSIQNIVTDTDYSAKAAIETLKRLHAGLATFLPLNTIKTPQESDEIRAAAKLAGYISRADKLVDCDSKFKPAVEFLLLRTVVFDTLDNAVEAARALHNKVRIVTLDGQLMNVGGSMTGGAAKNKGTGLLSRNGEIQTLLDSAKGIEKEIESIKEKIAARNEQIEEVNNKILDETTSKELINTMSSAQFKELESLRIKIEQNQNLIDKLKEDLENLEDQDKVDENDLSKTDENIKAILKKIESIKEYRERIETSNSGILDEKENIANKARDLDLQIVALNKDIDVENNNIANIQIQVDSIQSQMNEEQATIDALLEEVHILDLENSNNVTNKNTLEQEKNNLTTQRQDMQSLSKTNDKRLNELNNKIQIKEGEKVNLSRVYYEAETKFNDLQYKQDQLSSRLIDEYNMSYEQAVEANFPPVTEENEKEFRQLAQSCYNRLRNIGGYSPTAVEDYLAIKEKYDEVNGQYVDLKKSYDNLQEIIHKLEEEMATTFIESFEKINENFHQVFRELFGGGSAEISLTDPMDVLNSGIEIKAAPPGKNIKTLSLLSGGEQSFIAIALFFSILKLHPTPFCILDEVEAALDEVNVFRFGEYIKKFCGDTQFIVITHRRGTMQVADRLYGVTMPERGISKIIAVDVKDIDSKKNELTDAD